MYYQLLFYFLSYYAAVLPAYYKKESAARNIINSLTQAPCKSLQPDPSPMATSTTRANLLLISSVLYSPEVTLKKIPVLEYHPI
jgi:hypothetical protein